MTKAFLTEVQGWTPVIDALVTELGLLRATIYGIVWRFCQMDDRRCSASVETIAARAGVSYRTALRHLKALCDAGYLRDLTPERRNRPHLYADSGRAQIVGLVDARVGLTESQSAMTESQSHYDRESHEDSTLREKKKRVANPDAGASAGASTSWAESRISRMREARCRAK